MPGTGALKTLKSLVPAPVKSSFHRARNLMRERMKDVSRRLRRPNLYDFHSAVLASGSIPPTLMEAEIWDRLTPAPA